MRTALSEDRRARVDGYCSELAAEIQNLGRPAVVRRLVECACPRIFVDEREVAAVTYEEHLGQGRVIVRPAWELDERARSYPVPAAGVLDLRDAAQSVVAWLARAEQLERAGRQPE